MRWRHGTLRRTIEPAIIYLLLGAIANVAVAWGCETFRPGETATRYFTAREAQDFCARVIPETATLPTKYFWGCDYCGRGWHAPQADGYGNPNTPLRDFYVEMRIAGWPLASLEGWFWILPGSQIRSDSLWYTDFRRPASNLPPLLLPLRPVWPGFLLNSIIYAALLWQLVILSCWVLRGLRGRPRARRGLCPRCGYDLRGGLDAGCPECGLNRPDAR